MPQEEDSCRFSQIERLKSSLSIKTVVDGRQSVSSFPVKCFYQWVDGNEHPTQLAVVVPKRRFKHAVDRNRGKRLLREAFRLNKSLIPACEGKSLQMCWIYTGSELASFEEITASVQRIYMKMKAKLAPKDSL